jgi:hypothetical protein
MGIVYWVRKMQLLAFRQEANLRLRDSGVEHQATELHVWCYSECISTPGSAIQV